MIQKISRERIFVNMIKNVKQMAFVKRSLLPLFFFSNIVFSIFPRVSFVHRISSVWRSNQTLLTSYWFQKEAISLLHAQLPIYGPPWEVPFEFPLYQVICTLSSTFFQLDLTYSSRVVSITIFFISSLFLLLLCNEFLEDKLLSLIIFSTYLWLPYNIRYSTEILIDYLAVTFALGYIFWIKKFVDSPNKFIFFFLSTLFGCLGAAVKITTMAIVIIPAILIAISGIQKWGGKVSDLTGPKELFERIFQQRKKFLSLTLIAFLPFFTAVLWTKHADDIKQSNVLTTWLTSKALTGWNYGTLEMKTNFSNWLSWLAKINDYFFLDGILLIFLLISIVFLYKIPLKSRCFLGAAILSVFLTIFIFFNLYLHEYYYIAISAYMSVIVGFGIYSLIKFILPKKNWWIVLSLLFFFFVLMRGVEQYKKFNEAIQAEISYTESKFIPLAKRVAENTPEDEYVIAFQSDWYPDFIFYTQRKGLILSPREYNKYSCELINQHAFSTIVVVDTGSEVPEQLGIFNCFTSTELIEPGIYKVKM